MVIFWEDIIYIMKFVNGYRNDTVKYKKKIELSEMRAHQTLLCHTSNSPIWKLTKSVSVLNEALAFSGINTDFELFSVFDVIDCGCSANGNILIPSFSVVTKKLWRSSSAKSAKSN